MLGGLAMLVLILEGALGGSEGNAMVIIWWCSNMQDATISSFKCHPHVLWVRQFTQAYQTLWDMLENGWHTFPSPTRGCTTDLPNLSQWSNKKWTVRYPFITWRERVKSYLYNLCYNPTQGECPSLIKDIFQTIWECQLYLNPLKCWLCAERCLILGHAISQT